MSKIKIGYEKLIEAGAPYRSGLERQEPAVRFALSERGIDDNVHWQYEVDAYGHVRLRLMSHAVPSGCLARVLPLDLTLGPEEFARLISKGRSTST